MTASSHSDVVTNPYIWAPTKHAVAHHHHHEEWTRLQQRHLLFRGAAAGDRGRRDEVYPVEAGDRRGGGMGTTILLVAVLTAVVATTSTAAIIKDGSVASAAFRGEWASAAAPQPWHDDDASGAAKRRRHDSPDFDQIIVETLEQPPARHRPSVALILFLFITGLFAGAMILALCVLCLLKSFNGQIAYHSVAQKDDKFCVVENRGKPLADVMFKQRPAQVVAESHITRKERDLPRSARDVSYTPRELPQYSARDAPLYSARDMPAYNAPGDYRELRYSREQQHHTRESSNKRRGAYKASANAQQRQEPCSDDENVDDHNYGKTLSNLRLDLRINQEPHRKNRYASGGGSIRQYPPDSYSASSYSSGENMNISHASKSRPLLFSLSPDKKPAKDRGSKTSVRDARTHRAKESMAVRRSDSRDSQVSEVDENFFGEQNAAEVYQSIKTNTKAGRPRSRNTEPIPRRASTTPHLGSSPMAPQHEDGVRQHVTNATDQLTLDQVKALIDEILNKKANKKGKDSS